MATGEMRTLDLIGQVYPVDFSNNYEIRKGLVYIDIGAGFPCVIDEADLPKIQITKRWRAQRVKNYPGLIYAHCSIRGEQYAMHRILTNAPKGMHVDHVDGDGLNNRGENIRLATASQNIANAVAFRNNRLGLRGVRTRTTTAGNLLYRSDISHMGKRWFLGNYPTKEEAHAARKGAEKVLYGEFSPCK
tara:strand:+ start:275 stop:841 length:567 start_codon:yes stop_codon:yes gene_type:complete